MRDEIVQFKVIKLYYNDAFSLNLLYIKEHKIAKKCELLPKDHTLMVLNIPPILNEDIVKKAFQQIAKVQRIVLTNESKMFSAELDSSRKDSCFGFKIAYVVFAKPSGLKKALKMEQLHVKLEKDFGPKKWMTDYNNGTPELQTIKDQINNYFKAYDKRVLDQKHFKDSKETDNEDDWITVTKNDRKRPISYNRSIEPAAKKSKTNELVNFYSFQIRESKMKSLEDLRKKSTENQKFVNAMRKFGKFEIDV